MEYSGIKAFAFDVDGVFTDGGILCDLQGELYRTFDSKDGFAVRMAAMNGYPVGIITGGRSVSIRQRFLTSGIPGEDVYLGSRDKVDDFHDFCKRHGLKPEEVLFIGDDMPDIPVLQLCGCAMCPADAVEEVKSVCHAVSEFPGGKGCVRQAIESVLKARGDWNFDVSEYKRRF